MAVARTKAAVARADALLLEKLSPEQCEDYARSRSFLVTTPGGRRYRLHADRVNFQADLLAPESEYVLASYCVQPRDSLVPKSDSLLSQMLLLQSDEARFLLTANVNPKVSSLHRYLNGEIRPRTPEWHQAALVSRHGTRRALCGIDDATIQIQNTYRCANHPDAGVRSLSPSDDGRGWRVRYDCDCPTQYVSLRAHEERQAQLQAQARARNFFDTTVAALQREQRRTTIRPMPLLPWTDPLGEAVRLHSCSFPRCSSRAEYRPMENDYRVQFDCGVVTTLSASRLVE